MGHVKVKKFKMEIKNKFYIKSIIFALLRHWMHKFQEKPSTFTFLTYATRAQVNISLILYKKLFKYCFLIFKKIVKWCRFIFKVKKSSKVLFIKIK